MANICTVNDYATSVASRFGAVYPAAQSSTASTRYIVTLPVGSRIDGDHANANIQAVRNVSMTISAVTPTGSNTVADTVRALFLRHGSKYTGTYTLTDLDMGVIVSVTLMFWMGLINVKSGVTDDITPDSSGVLIPAQKIINYTELSDIIENYPFKRSDDTTTVAYSGTVSSCSSSSCSSSSSSSCSSSSCSSSCSSSSSSSCSCSSSSSSCSSSSSSSSVFIAYFDIGGW